jgi:hypothetical protein
VLIDDERRGCAGASHRQDCAGALRTV